MSLTKRLHEVRTPAGPSRRDPVLDELRQKIHHHLIDELGPLLYDRRLGEDDLRVRVQDQLQKALAKEKAPLSAADKAQLVQDVSDDILGFGPLNPATARFLEACVVGRLNCIVAGGTGTGKTTTLNVLSSFIPDDERIVTIEDAKELQLHQDHVLAMEARPPNIEGRGQVTIRDLVRNSLRMRPDRIVVGEVRGGEALDMLQAMNTGHDGSITTVHANSPRDALARVEPMQLMAGFRLPVRAIREQMA